VVELVEIQRINLKVRPASFICFIFTDTKCFATLRSLIPFADAANEREIKRHTPCAQASGAACTHTGALFTSALLF
jgi:hypothetical protein